MRLVSGVGGLVQKEYRSSGRLRRSSQAVSSGGRRCGSTVDAWWVTVSDALSGGIQWSDRAEPPQTRTLPGHHPRFRSTTQPATALAATPSAGPPTLPAPSPVPCRWPMPPRHRPHQGARHRPRRHFVALFVSHRCIDAHPRPHIPMWACAGPSELPFRGSAQPTLHLIRSVRVRRSAWV